MVWRARAQIQPKGAGIILGFFESPLDTSQAKPGLYEHSPEC